MAFVINDRLIEKKDGTLAARIERGILADDTGGEIVRMEGNQVKNQYGTVLAEIKDGKIMSTSGYELSTVAKARVEFENSNRLTDIEVGTAWLCLVKGIK